MLAPFRTMAAQLQKAYQRAARVPPVRRENTNIMKMRVSRFLAPLVLGAAAVALAAVHTDYDHRADFSHYHTYSWIGVHAGDSLWQHRIMTAIDSQLAAKGWTKVPSGGGAAVAAFGKTTERDTLETFYNGFPDWGWRGWGGIGSAETQVIPEEVGSLTVDIFNASNHHLIWRGSGTQVLSSKPEKNEKKLDHAVAEMFKHFPPQPTT